MIYLKESEEQKDYGINFKTLYTFMLFYFRQYNQDHSVINEKHLL